MRLFSMSMRVLAHILRQIITFSRNALNLTRMHLVIMHCNTSNIQQAIVDNRELQHTKILSHGRQPEVSCFPI